MINAAELLKDAQGVTDLLVDDLRERSESDEAGRVWVIGQYDRAVSAERTDKSLEEWREDLLAQTASSWTLACVFVRFCEDNQLVDTPLLSGPGQRRSLARDHRSAWLSEHPTQGDRAWLLEVFSRSKQLPGLSSVLGDANPVWSDLTPSEDGARALLDLWWKADDEGVLVHDFTDGELDTRFLGDLYQDLSEHARKQYALLQTPEFVEEFILDRTLDPAIETFGLEGFRMIDPTCGSGHFLLGAFDRLVERWRQAEPSMESRTLVQRALDAVNGVDINPFAVAIAQFRLLVAGLKAAGIERLAAAPDFEFWVAAGDSLIHGQHVQDELVPSEHSIIHHFYAAEDRELLAGILREDYYHAVVGNPPYITVKDKAVRDAVRDLYNDVCYGKYALSVPFAKRFHDLAILGSNSQPAGFVGQITSNSFMKRQFGTQLVNEWLPTKDVTHIIDTSGAYIPGHGTPTVILLSRNQWSQGRIRAVLGIRGEPGRPDHPAEGKVWSAIRHQVDEPDSESDYVSVEDVTDDRFADHPWSLQGGAAPEVMGAVEKGGTSRLGSKADSIGITCFTLEDDVFLAPPRAMETAGLPDRVRRPMLTGDLIRDHRVSDNWDEAVFPYGEGFEPLGDELPQAAYRRLWPARTNLANNRMFGNKTKLEAGLHWTEFGRLTDSKLRTPMSIVFAFVSTHNHFVLDRGGKVFKQSAPIIKLPEGASEEDHLALLGLLNSSTSCFWMKHVFHCKGSTVDKAGARQTTVPFEDFYEFDSTKLQQFPLPDGAPTVRARRLDAAARRLSGFLPGAVAGERAPTSEALSTAMSLAGRLRWAMVALQEELDWECYRLYGLVDEDLTYSTGRLPELELGQRAFEIALARRMAAGEAESTWFERHGSTPITELPADWPDDYRRLVERRLALIGDDRAIRLLERPEYKRRWNWDDLDELAAEAQERWLTDRIESWVAEDPDEPEVTTVARLADRLLRDEEARQVAEDLEGQGVDLSKLVGRLVADEGVPFLACDRLKPGGLRTRAVWERTWELQRIEDQIDRRVELPEDDPGHLSEEEAQVERKQQGVDKIPVPPKYKSSQYADKTTWKLRGKLDVPKERFVLYPQTQVGADTSAVVGWAGWDHLQQARALAGLYVRRKQAGAGRRELGRLLAGIQELLPWVLQWHDEPDPTTGDRMGQFLTGFVDTERQGLGLTEDDLTGANPNAIDEGGRRVIDAGDLLSDAQRVTDLLVDDLRERSESDEAGRVWVIGQYDRAVSAERTDKSLEEWREDLLAQTASSWTLACVFVRFCEDNQLVDTPLLSGPGQRRSLARDHRSAWLSEHPTQGDRAWLLEVFSRSKQLPGLSSVLGDANPVWSDLTPSEDGARALLDLWWKADDEGVLVHDFTDGELDTRFLGDLYQDLSEHARKQYALLQTPEFVEEFILDRTLDPAIETFGLEGFRMIDPTCGSGHFLLGAFDRLVERWRQAEPSMEPRTVVQRALDSVSGVDINPFAVAIARFRLLVAALTEARIDQLAAAPDFTLRVATGDSLLHGTYVQDELLPTSNSPVHHFYASEDRALASALLRENSYHAVVGNPPYITSRDAALTSAYRDRYSAAYREFQLTVPFMQRFFWLAVSRQALEVAGFVGAIIGNAFMARQFGRRFVEDFLPKVRLDAVIDTSGAHIPGHGTPTVILLGRPETDQQGPVRAVLGIRGEPGIPDDPSRGSVWTAIVSQIDRPGSESQYVSVRDVPPDRFHTHPWSLEGGAAGEVKEVLDRGPILDSSIEVSGYTGQTNADPAFIADRGSFTRRGVESDLTTAFVTGEFVLDFIAETDVQAILPYDLETHALVPIGEHSGLYRWLWPVKTVTWARRTFNKKSYKEDGRSWWEWHQCALDRVSPPTIVFAFVATHNHFVLDSAPVVTNRSAPLIKLPEGASDEDHLRLLGALNSSAACFWMKQVFHNKSKTASGTGGNVDEPWEQFYEFDSTKLKQFPLPKGATAGLAGRLDVAARRLSGFLPGAVAGERAPTSEALSTAMSLAGRLRWAMVALQEELDWECYRLYGLVDEDLTYSTGRLPELELGQRAFEIALARRMAAGEAESTWFERHGSTPITELPADWPDDYRRLVERRLALIGDDRAIRLLERPEYKRRWNWDDLDELAAEAQERWLTDRIESWVAEDPDEPEVTTVARLADRLLRDEEARQVAEDLEGQGVDLSKLVGRLVADEGVPFLACDRLKPGGLRTRAVWERTWELQRIEDQIDRRVELPEDDPGHLSEEEAQVERKQQGVDKIPVPPKYKSSQYADKTTWKLRGKLDVPKERFVLYPQTQVGADTSAVVGWAGWDHLQQARALAGLYVRRKQAGAGRRELGRLLAGIQELLPWVLQWHDEPDPTTGDRMGQFLTGFVDTERQGLGLTADDLTGAAPNEISEE